MRWLMLLTALATGCAGTVPERVCWQPSLGAYGVEVKANRRAYWGPGYLCGQWPAHMRRTR